jgi:drug/metabolite transporter (DMT)-like permease
MMPPVGLVLGLSAALAWGLTDISATIVSRRVGTLITAAAMQVTAVVLIGGLFLLSGQSLPPDPFDFAQVVAVGAFSAVGYLATYQAFRLGPISVVSPVMSAYGGLTVILAVIILGETLTAVQALGAVVATLGVVLAGVVLSRDLRRTRLVSPGVVFAVIALLLWAWFTILLAGPIRSAGWLPVIAVSRTVTGVVLWITVAAALWFLWSRPPRPGPAVADGTAASDGAEARGDQPTVSATVRDPASLRRALRVRSTLLLMVAMGVFDACGYVAFSIGLEGSTAWLVGLAGSLAPIVTVFFGVGWLGERLRPTQWAGIGLVLAGVVIIGLP